MVFFIIQKTFQFIYCIEDRNESYVMLYAPLFQWFRESFKQTVALQNVETIRTKVNKRNDTKAKVVNKNTFKAEP